MVCFCFQAEDGIRDLVRSRGLGDVYKRQLQMFEKVLPEKVQDFVFLAAAAAHVFSSPDVVSHLSLIHI